MLCRKRRLIQPIVAALEEKRVPVEAVGTSGLLDRPEVVDVVAWLEVLADPSASVALLRLLAGPRYRIGFRDLAALSRHAAPLGRYDDDAQAEIDAEAAAATTSPDDQPRIGTALAPPPMVETILADALGDLDGAADLSPEARDRLAAFDRERQELADHARRLPVLDLVEAILARTGLWQAVGPVGRQNLLRFLDLAERFRPVEGDPGLAAFVEYLHLLDDSEEDVAEAHLGDADAVKVMTIHQAKGLEFPTVYVPGMAGAKGPSRIFPDGRPGENALGNSSALPVVAAGGRRGLPAHRHRPHGRHRRRHPPAQARRGVAPALRGLHPGPAAAGVLRRPLVPGGGRAPGPVGVLRLRGRPDRHRARVVPPRGGHRRPRGGGQGAVPGRGRPPVP